MASAHRYRPAGYRRRSGKALVYGPTGTGCPAVETAIEGLYHGQNEESFWALISALNYAIQLETRVLVPLQTSPCAAEHPAPWAENPLPAQRAKGLPLLTLHTEKGQHWLPLFTMAAAARAGSLTANCPMAELAMEDAMEQALASPEIDGVVINPWTRSATLDCSLLNGLLKAAPAPEDEAGRQVLAGRKAAAASRWDEAAGHFADAAAAGNTEALTLLGECYAAGRGTGKDPAKARQLWRRAAQQGEINALLDLGDGCKDAGAALSYYRQARQLARMLPDISYTPRVCLRIAQTETRHLVSQRAQTARLCAEAAQGFKLLQGEGIPQAAAWLTEAEALAAELSEGESGRGTYKKSLQLD